MLVEIVLCDLDFSTCPVTAPNRFGRLCRSVGNVTASWTHVVRSWLLMMTRVVLVRSPQRMIAPHSTQNPEP